MEQDKITQMEQDKTIRNETYDKYKGFIDGMVIGKQKGIRFRKWFHNYLYRLANTIFKDDDEQYDNINKFGRGAWENERLKKTFNKKDLDIIIEIARGFGAFDY